MAEAKENALSVEIQIISSENVQNYQNIKIKRRLLEDLAVIATKMKRRRQGTKSVLWLKLLMSSMEALSGIIYDKNYNQLLPILAEKIHQEKVQQEKLKAVKAHLNFEETSQYSESEAPSRRKDVRKRLRPKDARNMSGSLEPRRDRSRSPRRKDLERETVLRRLEKGVFHRLGDKEKGMSAYSGSSRRQSHHSSRGDTESYYQTAKVERWVMPTWCHMFNSTLTKNARVWFDDLLPESIDSYDDLKEAFLANYLQQKKCIKDPVEIHHIKQREGESTEDFVRRFKIKIRYVKGAPKVMRISGFMHGITNPELIKRLHDKIPKSVDKMWKITTAFLRGEVAVGNQERKKTFPPWKQQDAGHRQNFKK
ncbi:reverse transcriptase domain-containing protein [Tanacetum coccineum]|uniref:Reverse transcriptase domain-containing protein n=1 Tax=Tanacetum coccineum TaxID=301880 RepID=A0ABQ5C0M6_9ASTR